MWASPQFPTDLVTFTEEIFNEKFHFSCIQTKLKEINAWHPNLKITLEVEAEGKVLILDLCVNHVNEKWSSRPMHATIPDRTDKILVSLPPPSLSHSPNLGCVGAQRIIFLGRFLV